MHSLQSSTLSSEGKAARTYTVTFETKCWEGDWDLILSTGRLEEMIRRCHYPFDKIVLYINNVKKPEEVTATAQTLQEGGVITSLVMVSDSANEALSFFGLDRNSFKGGYPYSVQELVGIYLCRTDFLLHFSGDSMMQNEADWIDKAIERLQNDQSLSVANPNWDPTLVNTREQVDAEDEEFFFGHGFSDQCYLIKASSFKRRIYDEWNPASERYPWGAMPTFEKRVDSYMRNHGLRRITSKHAVYKHENFPARTTKDKLRRALRRVRGYKELRSGYVARFRRLTGQSIPF